MTTEPLTALAALLHERNGIDERIAQIIHRPMTAGHAGEWIAAAIFGIDLDASAVNAAYDGRFRGGALSGKTVNIKWYLKREGLLDMSISPTLDYYLVMTGPSSSAGTSKEGIRPWCIDAVYLLDAQQLLAQLQARGLKIGVASSVRRAQWSAAEIYPNQVCQSIIVSPEQASLLRLFA